MATVTVLDAANASFAWILERDSVSPVGDAEIEDYIFALNNFMAGLEAENVILGYTPVTQSSDILTVPDGAIRGVIANLAVELAPSYDGQITPRLDNIAVTGLNQMRILGQTIPDTVYPRTLPIGSGNENDTGDLLFSHFYWETDEEEEEVIVEESFLVLALDGDPTNGAAETEDSGPLSITGNLTLIAWIKFNSYTIQTQAVMTKTETGEEPSYFMSMFEDRIFLQINDGIESEGVLSPSLNLVGGEGVWIRGTVDVGDTSMSFYRSDESLDTPYESINWVFINTGQMDITSIQEDDGSLEVGSLDGENSAAGFIGRAVVISGLDPTTGSAADMYPNRDASAGDKDWTSQGTEGEDWILHNTATLEVIT